MKTAAPLRRKNAGISADFQKFLILSNLKNALFSWTHAKGERFFAGKGAGMLFPVLAYTVTAFVKERIFR